MAMPVPARRTFTVANRLPLERHGLDDWRPSPGGLVSAMEPLLRDADTVWVGWGGVATTNGDPAPPPAWPTDHQPLELIEVPLSRPEVTAYYEGYCNSALWPVYHASAVAPIFRDDEFRAYRDVNQRFAECVAAHAPDGASVWVHDYHLQLVPQLLRRLRPDLRIGFFLHVPFPTPDGFRSIPQAAAIIDGLLGADLIGFQTATSVDRFLATLPDMARVEGHGATVPVSAGAGHRAVSVGAFPVGPPARRFDAAATAPETRQAAKAIRAEAGDPELLLLGVDRLDYTKGIERRLRVVGDLLRSDAFRHRRLRYLQLATPSRTALPTYQALRQSVEHTLADVNAELAAAGLPPIAYRDEHRSAAELTALYVAADVMLVTSLADGMNLVCKEYVASRSANDGRLVLSRTAGAAVQLTSAWLVDPEDPDDIARGIRDALTASPEEAERRMRALRHTVFAQDAAHWVDAFLTALRAPR